MTAAITEALQHVEVMRSIRKAMHSLAVHLSENLKYVWYQYQIFLFWIKIPSIFDRFRKHRISLSCCLSVTLIHILLWFYVVVSPTLISENRWLMWTDKAHLCLCHTAWVFVIIFAICVCLFDCVWVLPTIMIPTHTHARLIPSQYYTLNSKEGCNIPQLLDAERAYYSEGRACVWACVSECVCVCIDAALQHNLY